MKFIVFEVDSLGGAAEGVYGIVKTIKKLKKPTFAYVTSNALSGAYWVASAANAVCLEDKLCAVGSVGVYSTYIENSEQLKSSGLTLEIIRAGDLKAETTGFSALTEQGREILQERVDLIYETFKSSVKESRGEIEDKHLQGQPHYGIQAIERNLADCICTPYELQIKILLFMKGQK